MSLFRSLKPGTVISKDQYRRFSPEPFSPGPSRPKLFSPEPSRPKHPSCFHSGFFPVTYPAICPELTSGHCSNLIIIAESDRKTIPVSFFIMIFETFLSDPFNMTGRDALSDFKGLEQVRQKREFCQGLTHILSVFRSKS